MEYIDLSALVGVFIAVLMLIFIWRVWPLIKSMIPAGALAVVNWFAAVVVNAVETEFKSGEGQKKREEAYKRITTVLAPMIEAMNRYGFTIDAARVYEAIQAAWKQLDLKQKQAGEKIVPADETI